MIVRRVFTFMGYALWGSGIIAFIAGVMFWNWQAASRRSSDRLRWFLVAKMELPAHIRLTADHMEAHLGWLASSDVDYVYRVSEVEGKYTQRKFEKGDRLFPAALESSPSLKPPPGGAIIPVAVKAEHAGALKPGMRLAFAGPNGMVPNWKDTRRNPNPKGFGLLALIPLKDKSDSIAVLIELREDQGRYAQALTAANLVPVVLDR